MRRFHGEGISILGAFVFGSDHENKDVFEQTYEFIVKGCLDCVQLRILQPLPGTRLYTRLLSEGRLLAPDWWLRGYPPDTLLYQPKGMTADELLSGYARLTRQTYSFDSMLKRFFGISPWERSLRGCLTYAGINLSYRYRYLKGLKKPQPFLEAANLRGEAGSTIPGLNILTRAGKVTVTARRGHTDIGSSDVPSRGISPIFLPV